MWRFAAANWQCAPGRRRAKSRCTLHGSSSMGQTLQAIVGGRLSPVAAMEQGKLYLRTRLYGGALITILLRAAYDLARDRRLGAEE